MCAQAFSGEARFCPFDGDALVDAPDWNPSADPLLGKLVEGRYEVLSVIGEGGMGTVYEVRHAALGRRFALKVLRRDIADVEHTARFIQEAKAAAAIGHPNIVAVSDFGELANEADAAGAGATGAVPYFVMEYLSGISLAALLRAERTLEPVRAAEIVLQCAAGLSAAHAAGVIHRDLKPDNVFLTRSAEKEFVKLLDFGVAKMAGAGRLTRAGMVFGTPHYMSPEQAAGQSVDHRADVYALGVILYEALAGRVPFEADTYMGVLTKHMFATPEPIERVVPDASSLGALGPIAMRCLAKSPHDRFASMAELVAAIEAALADAGHGAGHSPRPGALGSERPKGRGRVGGESERPLTTPGLKPMVGPMGLAVGAVVAVLLLLLGVRELRGSTPTPPVVAAGGTAEPAAAPGGPSSAAPLAPGPSALAAPALAAGTGAAVAPSAARPATVTSASLGLPAKPAAGRGAKPRAATRGGGDVVDPWNK